MFAFEVRSLNVTVAILQGEYFASGFSTCKERRNLKYRMVASQHHSLLLKY